VAVRSKIQSRQAGVKSKILLCALCVLCVETGAPAREGLAGEAAQFLKDYDSLNATLAQIGSERNAMLMDLSDQQKLNQEVRLFFEDRSQALAARPAVLADRRKVRVVLQLGSSALARPTRSTGVLSQDAAGYLAAYDAWVALRQQVEVDIAAVRAALGSNDPAALEAAARALFADDRARLQKRLQWQQAISSMKKDCGFKGTGKPAAPEKALLTQHVLRFLNDRGAWDAYGLLVETDRNNLRAVVQGGQSLDAAAGTFLTDRHAQYVASLELGLDLKALRKDAGLGGGAAGAIKPGTLFAGNDLDKDEESSDLEETADAAGER